MDKMFDEYVQAPSVEGNDLVPGSGKEHLTDDNQSVYNLFDEFVQTFLVDGEDFLSGSGKTVFTADALNECLNKASILDKSKETKKYKKLLENFNSASDNAKLILSHAVWLYWLGQSVKKTTKVQNVKETLSGIPEPREEAFPEKGIASMGNYPNKHLDVLFILHLFKWIRSDPLSINRVRIRIISLCRFAMSPLEVDKINESFGTEAKGVIEEMGNLTALQTTDGFRALPSYNYLLNYCNPDFYEPIAVHGSKTRIVDEFYLEEYGPRKGLSIDDLISRIREQEKIPTGQLHKKLKAVERKGKDSQDAQMYFIFQSTPRDYDLVSALQAKAVKTWKVKKLKNEIKVGGKVIIWYSGAKAGCYALAEVRSNIYTGTTQSPESDHYIDRDMNTEGEMVDLKITHDLSKKPILATEINRKPWFAKLNIGIQGTNFRATQEQYEALKSMAEGEDRMSGTNDEPEKKASGGNQHPLNLILYGPPGTGKTYHTVDKALEILRVDVSDFNTRDEVKKEFDEKVKTKEIFFTTFHQSMSYEDFIEGIKPDTNETGNVVYKIKDGIFKKACVYAKYKIYKYLNSAAHKEEADDKIPLPHYNELKILVEGQKLNKEEWDNMKGDVERVVLIIDEINRGNVSQIFGELITLIEKDKRMGKQEFLSIILPYSQSDSEASSDQSEFSVPPNLYIIGTMNTADRSVEALDTALRRRFEFEEITADPELIAKEGALKDKSGVLERDGDKTINLVELLSIINHRLEKILNRDHLIGHSYFMSVTSIDDLIRVFKNQIIPLLNEYFYGDPGKIGLVLGSGFVEKIGSDKHNFAEFKDYEGSDDLKERPVYEVKVPDKDEFANAIDTLMKNGKKQNQTDNAQ